MSAKSLSKVKAVLRASQNFAFLRVHSRELVKLGTLAEYYFTLDPNTCMMKLRQYGEHLAQLVAATTNIRHSSGESQVDLLRRLAQRRAIAGQVVDLFHKLRINGNDAVHKGFNNANVALDLLQYARTLGIWFHRGYGKAKDFQAPPFVPPKPPEQEGETLKQEIARLQQALEQSKVDFLEVSEQLEETETAKEELETQLQALQAQAEQKSEQEIQGEIQQAQELAEPENIDLDEQATRRLIDDQLRAAGWEVDSENLTYQKGVRPQKNRNLAIAEWPTTNGRADYALFSGLQVIGVVEAKRQRKDVSSGAVNQAKRYSQDYLIQGDETFPAGSPWGDYKVPFVFATNGRKYWRQLAEKSGIWFCDLRRPSNLRRPLETWYKPDGLQDLLTQDIDQANERLKRETFNYGVALRDYQIKAIQAVEAAIERDQQAILLAMATGTGKTKTCIALVYRLLKTKRFRRVLFLVDRTSLGDQTTDAFRDTRLESLQNFTDIFDLKELKDTTPDRDTKVQIATVQSFVKRLLYAADDAPLVTSDQYDCIVVDECHRGYLLDRELSETELTFRDFEDYVSKYRQVLEHFDAVKIGLTATPALHTTEIFGEPVFTYSYREAVIDGFLIDYEVPSRIKTRLAEQGITWEQGETVEYWDPKTGQADLVHAEDEINVEIAQFNKKVITENFNRVVCAVLAEEIDPSLPEKTLIFCATDDHASMVVRLLKEALAAEYGSVDDDEVVKITGAADKPLELIRRYKNEESPKIAVTVDLLTTGIDVPKICNLVFIRRVNSRILYEQMIGRATRRCDEIGKKIFRVFDAVAIYETLDKVSTMKPLGVNPKISFTQLWDELERVSEPAAVNTIVDQLLAKLQRKRHRMSDANRDAAEDLAGMDLAEVVDYLKQAPQAEAAAWLQERRQIAQILDIKDGGGNVKLISHHEDERVGVEQGYGAGQRPEDYLQSFRQFLEENRDRLPALMVVTQRPRELTRADLKQLRLALDAAGFSEVNLQSAHRNASNEDIAASIIGFIRQAILDDELIPYEERVKRAIRKISMQQNWTSNQRKWLQRIGKQLEHEYVVDKDYLDTSPAFKSTGGFQRLNKIFDGQLETILGQLSEAIWEKAS